MDQKLNDSTRAIPRQTKIDAEADIQVLTLDELDRVAGGVKPQGGSAPLEYLRITMTNSMITSIS